MLHSFVQYLLYNTMCFMLYKIQFQVTNDITCYYVPDDGQGVSMQYI